MSEAISKKLEKEAVASVAVADQPSPPAVAATGQDRVHGLQGLRILVLVQQVFINEAMEVGVDLALARWNRGPKAEEFFTRMKDDVFDSWVDLRVSLGYAGTSWAEVKSSTAAIPACQAYASELVHLSATQPNVHCAIRSLIYFKLWNEMCKIVLAAAEDSGPFIEPYIERYAERAGDWKQVVSFMKSALAAADESGEALSSFKDLVDFASNIQHAELNQRTKELNARRIKRIREAPPKVVSRPVFEKPPAKVEERPEHLKFGSKLRLAMRVAKGPDGTKGFSKEYQESRGKVFPVVTEEEAGTAEDDGRARTMGRLA